MQKINCFGLSFLYYFCVLSLTLLFGNYVPCVYLVTVFEIWVKCNFNPLKLEESFIVLEIAIQGKI